MFRPATRLCLTRPVLARATAAPSTRRFLSTAPPTQKSRSWKSLVARLGVAGAIIYYYNTTDLFAEEPRRIVPVVPEIETENEALPTIDAIAEERKRRKAEAAAAQAAEKQRALAAEKAAAQQQQQQKSAAAPSTTPIESSQGSSTETQTVEELREEADQQGAFNPETGEINWDCPCLGGMADGPCGEEFKAAFSCFVYSTEEPKGMECVEKFKDMQNCFRQYPEIYGSELETDDDDDVTADQALADTTEPVPSNTEAGSADTADRAAGRLAETQPSTATKDSAVVPEVYREKAERQAAAEQGRKDGVQDVLPKAAHDATDANVLKKE